MAELIAVRVKSKVQDAMALPKPSAFDDDDDGHSNSNSNGSSSDSSDSSDDNDDELESLPKSWWSLPERPPVVTVMGHVIYDM